MAEKIAQLKTLDMARDIEKEPKKDQIGVLKRSFDALIKKMMKAHPDKAKQLYKIKRTLDIELREIE
jgi:hypothetical protein